MKERDALLSDCFQSLNQLNGESLIKGLDRFESDLDKLLSNKKISKKLAIKIIQNMGTTNSNTMTDIVLIWLYHYLDRKLQAEAVLDRMIQKSLFETALQYNYYLVSRDIKKRWESRIVKILEYLGSKMVQSSFEVLIMYLGQVSHQKNESVLGQYIHKQIQERGLQSEDYLESVLEKVNIGLTKPHLWVYWLNRKLSYDQVKSFLEKSYRLRSLPFREAPLPLFVRFYDIQTGQYYKSESEWKSQPLRGFINRQLYLKNYQQIGKKEYNFRSVRNDLRALIKKNHHYWLNLYQLLALGDLNLKYFKP
jgi:hypothetical protein